MARDFQRIDRVGAQLQRELSSMIHDEVDEPGLGMVTVQEVRVVRDFSQAKVFFTVMGNELSRAGMCQAIESGGRPPALVAGSTTQAAYGAQAVVCL